MPSDADKRLAASRYLRRTKTADEIRLIADQAFSDIQAGKTVTSVSFEGGATSSIENCNPTILLNACEDVLDELGVTDSAPSVSQSIFTRFGRVNAQT
jgi:hypothetical protein